MASMAESQEEFGLSCQAVLSILRWPLRECYPFTPTVTTYKGPPLILVWGSTFLPCTLNFQFFWYPVASPVAPLFNPISFFSSPQSPSPLGQYSIPWVHTRREFERSCPEFCSVSHSSLTTDLCRRPTWCTSLVLWNEFLFHPVFTLNCGIWGCHYSIISH